MDRFKYNMNRLNEINRLLEPFSMSDEIQEKYSGFFLYSKALGTNKEYKFVFGDDRYKNYNRRYFLELSSIASILCIVMLLLFSYGIWIRIIFMPVAVAIVIFATIENMKYKRYKIDSRDKYFKEKNEELFSLCEYYEGVVNYYYTFEVKLGNEWRRLNDFDEYFKYYYMYGIDERIRARYKTSSGNKSY